MTARVARVTGSPQHRFGRLTQNRTGESLKRVAKHAHKVFARFLGRGGQHGQK